MTLLLDTNVVSELRKPVTRQDERVRRWAGAADSGTMFLSVVTIVELETGIERVARRDPRQGDALRRWLTDRVLVQFARRILPVDLAVARRAAPMHVPDRRPDLDCLIAATGIVHDLTVVTRNVRDFEPLGVRVLDPWSAPE